MGIRLPLQTVLTYSETGTNVPGASSIAGGTPLNFYVPQDTDNMVVKLIASVTGGGYSATVQTTDDGGTTWYDVARSSTVSNANNTTAQFISVPVISSGINPIVNSSANSGSILGGTIGSAAASTLGSRQVSGLPILGTLNRVFLISTGTITATSIVQVQVKVNSQAAHA